MLLILLAGIALWRWRCSRAAAAGAPRRRADRAGAGALPQPGGAAAGRAGAALCWRSAPRSRSAAAPGTSSPAPTSQFPTSPEQHFGQLSGAGRHEFWRVAVDAFGEKPVLGHGAGTYQFSWDQLRRLDLPVHDAHSLYLEAFAELGLVGGLTVLGLVGFLLWIGVRGLARRERGRSASSTRRCWRHRSPSRSAPAIDWFWEIAAVGAIFFLAGGALVAARCGQLAPGARGRRRRPGERALRARGRRAWRWPGSPRWRWSGRCWSNTRSTPARPPPPKATSPAPSTTPTPPARSSPGRPPPTSSSACWRRLQGDYATADERLTQAIDRENHNWQLYYLRAQSRARGRRPSRRRRRPRRSAAAEPPKSLPAEGFEGCG